MVRITQCRSHLARLPLPCAPLNETVVVVRQLGSTSPLPDECEDTFWQVGNELCELLTRIRRSLSAAQWTVHVNDRTIPWDGASDSYSFSKVNLPPDVLSHLGQLMHPAAEENLQAVRQWLVRRVSLAEIEDYLARQDRSPEAQLLRNIFGEGRDSDYSLRQFRNRLAGHMIQGDELWWYDGQVDGEWSGAALVRNKRVITYLALESAY